MDQVDKSNRVQVKQYQNRDVDILFKFIKYDRGYLFKYVNETDEYRLHETLTFDMDNCYICG